MTHLLDTDSCIGVLRQKPGYVQRLSALSPGEVAISAITTYELFCGVEKARDPAVERAKVERFISAIVELQLDRLSIQKAAQLRADLENRGMPIGPYDLLIAGQALAHGLVLVTNNVREFQRAKGLVLISWP
jgi:tRNA(fMet)-specific endonuclease VapC